MCYCSDSFWVLHYLIVVWPQLMHAIKNIWQYISIYLFSFSSYGIVHFTYTFKSHDSMLLSFNSQLSAKYVEIIEKKILLLLVVAFLFIALWKSRTSPIIIFLLLQGLSSMVLLMRVCCWQMVCVCCLKKLFLLGVWKASLLVRNSEPTTWSFFFPTPSHSSLFSPVPASPSSTCADPLSYNLPFFNEKSDVLLSVFRNFYHSL